MSEQNRKEKEAWSRRAQEAEAAGEPLKRHIRDLEAARDAHQQDIQSVSLNMIHSNSVAVSVP